MRLLVTSAHPTIRQYADSSHIGRLVVPKDCARVAETAELMPWAADNGAYGGFDEPAFRRMLNHIAALPGCLFVCAPDVVADANATLDLFADWHGELEDAFLPVALVAQDGLTTERVPWDRIDALFIGGSTEWKLGVEAWRLVQEAKRRGLWVHMGRVNTFRRLRYARAIGCDSADGSKFARWRDTYLPHVLTWLAEGEQLRMEESFA